MNLRDLAAPFPGDEIEWRVGSTNGDKTKGLALAYLTARHVMDRLDDVCGPENWMCSYVETPKGRMIGTISIRVGDDWVSKSDGAGDSDVEAEKGAISDALKRAAVPWGIGRYLYSLSNIWVDLTPAGRSYKIADHEKARLQKFVGGSALAPASAPKGPGEPAPKPLTVAERKALWSVMMDDLKAEAPKGWEKMTAYVKDAETQRLIATLGPHSKQFLDEAREIVRIAKNAEEALGEPVGGLKTTPYNFDQLDSTSTVGDMLDATENAE